MSTTRRMASAAPSPKVLAQAVTSVVVWVAAHYGLDLDPDVSSAIAVVLAFVVGYVVKPGAVVNDLKATSLRSEGGYYDPVYLIVLLIVVVVLIYVLLRLLG
jgi:putative flippase GtrA